MFAAILFLACGADAVEQRYIVVNKVPAFEVVNRIPEQIPTREASCCSPLCECGCNVGGPCICRTLPVSSPPVYHYPQQHYIPPAPPMYYFYQTPMPMWGGCPGGVCR